MPMVFVMYRLKWSVDDNAEWLYSVPCKQESQGR